MRTLIALLIAVLSAPIAPRAAEPFAAVHIDRATVASSILPSAVEPALVGTYPSIAEFLSKHGNVAEESKGESPGFIK